MTSQTLRPVMKRSSGDRCGFLGEALRWIQANQRRATQPETCSAASFNLPGLRPRGLRPSRFLGARTSCLPAVYVDGYGVERDMAAIPKLIGRAI